MAAERRRVAFAGRRLAPFVLAGAVGIGVVVVDTDAHSGSRLFAGAGMLTAVLAASMAGRSLPRQALTVAPVLFLLSTGIAMRGAGGLESAYLPQLVVPLLWIAMYEPPRLLRVALAGAVAFVGLETMAADSRDDALTGVIAISVGAVVLPALRSLLLERDLAHESLQAIAETDPLTHLANRRALAVGGGPSKRRGVVFVDLDGFKAVNDRLGHDAGDDLLVQVAHRLRGATRAGDLLARVGGDEFVIVCDSTPDATRQLAARVDEAIRSSPFDLSGSRLTLTASVGYSHSDVVGDDLAQLLMDADQAMYAAKRLELGSRETRRPPPPATSEPPAR